MKLDSLFLTVKSVGKNISFFAKDHAPEICMIAGGIGVFASIAAAIKGTFDFQEVMEEHKNNLEALHEVEEKVANGDITVEYTEEQGKKDRVTIYIRTTWGIIKAYGPSIALAVLSVFLFLTGGKILNKRYLKLASVCQAMALKAAQQEQKIMETVGDDTAAEIKYPHKAVEVTDSIEDPVTGLKINDVHEEMVPDPSQTDKLPLWAKIFDSSSGHWEDDAESNRIFLSRVEAQLNNELRRRAVLSPDGIGRMFLNEVYKRLDFEQTQAGQILGWVYYTDPEKRRKAQAMGINCDISFGIFDLDKQWLPGIRRFMNGLEPCVIITPNVSVPILGVSGMGKV